MSALAYSVGGSEALIELLYKSKRNSDTYKKSSITRTLGFFGGTTGLAYFKPLKKSMMKMFEGKNMRIPIYSEALDLTLSGHPAIGRRFHRRVDEEVIDWVLAGMSVRGLIKPHEYRWVDAGSHNIIPEKETVIQALVAKELWLINGAHYDPKGIPLDELKKIKWKEHLSGAMADTLNGVWKKRL